MQIMSLASMQRRGKKKGEDTFHVVIDGDENKVWLPRLRDKRGTRSVLKT